MPGFDLTINVIVLLIMLMLAAIFGFLLRAKQLAKRRRQIIHLEREMLVLSEEILQVQKEYCQLANRLQDPNIPVIPIKQATKDDAPKKDGRTA